MAADYRPSWSLLHGDPPACVTCCVEPRCWESDLECAGCHAATLAVEQENRRSRTAAYVREQQEQWDAEDRIAAMDRAEQLGAEHVRRMATDEDYYREYRRSMREWFEDRVLDVTLETTRRAYTPTRNEG